MSAVRVIRRRPVASAGQWPAQVPALLQRIFAARGALDLAQAQPALGQLLPPTTLKDIETASALLAQAITAQQRILVVGDFDCDGATACAVAVRGLRMLGAAHVVHAVPNRIRHGYGLSPGLVDELAALAPALLLTVDHGIACHAGIQAAKARGWQVVVTDHHLAGPHLPPADAIVNPNQPGDGFPSKALAGVGVVFYVLLALRAHLRAHQAFADGRGPDLGRLLDLVAVGTVADLVPLDANNRALVRAGLRRLRAGHGCPGLAALIEVSGRDPHLLTAADIGYAVAPRLNAAGRLDDMGQGIACLLSENPAQAMHLAQGLDAINAERRQVQDAMVAQANEAIAACRHLPQAPGQQAAFCLYDDSWHPGVVGLVASRLKERLHRPVVAFAPAEPGSTQLRGSARSIPGFHIRDALAVVDSAQPGLIDRFGGHAMAAGLSLDSAHLEAFTTAFVAHADSQLDASGLQAVLDSDGALDDAQFDRYHAELLRDAGPWGQGFPEPLFDGVFTLVDWRIVGQRHLRMRLRTGQGAAILNAIAFGAADTAPPPARVQLAYRLAPDDYRGGEAVQLVVEHLAPAGD